MFGVVPKTLWSKKTEPDELNRVMLGLNCAVVRIAGKTVLIETGFGNKIAPKLKEIYATQQRLPASLAAAGHRAGSGHRHRRKHAPALGPLRMETPCSTKRVRPRRPLLSLTRNTSRTAAKSSMDASQWERDRISYVADNYEPMIASGQMRLIEGTEADDLQTGSESSAIPVTRST